MSEDTLPTTVAHVTTELVAKYVAGGPSEAAIDRFVADMPPDTVPLLVARATPIRKALQYMEKAAEGRMATERILAFGEQWIDPESGVLYTFAGTPGEYVVRDPEGLRAALAATGKVSALEIDIAVQPSWKCDHTQLNLLARRHDSVRETIEDFRERKPFQPAHLREAK